MNKKILLLIGSSLMLSGCNLINKVKDEIINKSSEESPIKVDDNSNIEDNGNVTNITTDDEVYSYSFVSDEDGVVTYKDSEENTKTLTIEYVKGTEGTYTIEGNTITFSNVAKKTEYSLKGEFYGNIVIDATDDYKFQLDLNGLTLTSYDEVPININSADKAIIVANESTTNYIYDYREAVDEDDEDAINAAIYSKADLDIEGTGSLNVYSKANKGIHTKDDLSIKEISMQVECEDNCLKGNDSLTIGSGNYTLIARTGDCLKTDNSDISDKGNQRGTIDIQDGTLYCYSATDGIDASYNVTIGTESTTPNIQILTDKYSKYSEEVTATSSSSYYLRSNTTSYKYSIYYYNTSSDYKWVNASTSYTTVNGGGGFGGQGRQSTYYYYTVEKPSNYAYFIVYAYNSNQNVGQSDSYAAKSSSKTFNTNYDTITLNVYSSSITTSFTNYQTNTNPGGMGGMGSQSDGNQDKQDYSTKGIKADNEIIINSGNIAVKAYDDAIHANCDNELENGASPLGNITINNGTLKLYSNDDGIHADGTLTINNGTIDVQYSYEGLEGSQVIINGGSNSIVSSDDGINGTSETAIAIEINGGTNYIYAGGDGVDSNSTSSYEGLVINGGYSVIIQTSGGNSALDTERGYKYTSGKLLAIGNSSGMTNETTYTSSFNSIGKSKTLSSTSYVSVNDTVIVKLPKSMSCYVAYLGSNSVTISSISSTSVELDGNGVYWY